MACAICETRRPRRFCPGVRGDICSICCGTEREVSIACPFDCPYLEEARRRERSVAVDPEQVPNRDIDVTEEFLTANQELCLILGDLLRRTALEIPGVVDNDVREALDGLIRTYRTLQSGVYYESVPTNPLAAGIFRKMQEIVADLHREEQKRGMSKTRDADVLGILVFLERIELDRNNGRPRGRAFLHALHQFQPAGADAEGPADDLSSPLLLP